jgi:hypothetical protein
MIADVGLLCLKLIFGSKLTGTIHPRTGHEGPEWKQRYSSTLSLTSALDGGGWLKPRSGRFFPGKEARYPIVQESGWP